MDPETIWWRLPVEQRAAIECIVSYIVYECYHGNRYAVLGLIASAYTKNKIAWKSPLVSIIVWRLQQEVEIDD